MQLNKLAPEEVDRVSKLQPEGWSGIAEAFQFYIDSGFCNPIKVSIDDSIIGIGSSILFDNSAWLAHIIVDKDFRNRGIGYQIVRYLLDDIENKRIETVLLIATEIGEPIYVKAGFRKVSDYHYFKREDSCIQMPLSDKIKPYTNIFYNDIIRLDTLISGECREKLIGKYLDKSFLYVDNNVVKGFYIPNLGEGPIYADTIDAGTELMKLKYSTADKAVIPSENQVGIEFLKQLGFIKTDSKGKRMILGKDITWQPEKMYSRIGGNFG